MNPSRHRRQGFTLLEILIAMVLVSMIVLIVAQAFGIAVDAWERGSRQVEHLQIRQAVPELLARQLRAVVPDNLFNPAMGDFRLRFCGKSDSLSFLTTYSPLGTSLQGLQRITYIYVEEKLQLSIYQQVITQPDDFGDEFNPLSSDWQEDFDPISRFEQITAFELWFTLETAFEIDNEDHWQRQWDCGESLQEPGREGLPVAVMLRLEAGQPARPATSRWLLAVGTR